MLHPSQWAVLQPSSKLSDNSLLLRVGLWVHYSPHLLTSSPWLCIFSETTGVGWLDVGNRFSNQGSTTGCFLLDGMTQWSRETQWCLLEVCSEFSKPKTVGLPAETQKITDTPPFLSLPSANSPYLPAPPLQIFPKTQIPPSKSSKRMKQRHTTIPWREWSFFLANCSRNAAQTSQCLKSHPVLPLVFQKSIITVNSFTRQINLWMKYILPPLPNENILGLSCFLPSSSSREPHWWHWEALK